MDPGLRRGDDVTMSYCQCRLVLRRNDAVLRLQGCQYHQAIASTPPTCLAQRAARRRCVDAALHDIVAAAAKLDRGKLGTG